MLAFVLDDTGPRLVRDQPLPRADRGLVRVRSRVAGICNTDLELVRGYMGFRGVLGHEFVGEALDGAYAGRRVVGGINFGCGDCASCTAGLSRHCPTRRVLGILAADGVLAEEFVIPERNLVAVPDAIDDETAVFAEPLAAACEILDQLGSVRPRRALVIGAGKLGSLVAQVLAVEDVDVTVEGRHLERLAWLSERGVRLTAPAMDDDRRYELVVEATGSAAGLSRAVRATAPRGTLVLKTTVAVAHQIDLAPVVIDEITIVGSRCGRLEPALDRLSDGRVDVRSLIDGRYPLEQVERAFAHAAERGTRKVLVSAD